MGEKREVSGAYGPTVNLKPAGWVDESRAQFALLLGLDRCTWCGGRPAPEGACTACRESLPWNRPACPACARPGPTEARCPACVGSSSPWDAAWTAFVLEAPIQGLVHGLKYHDRFDHGRLLGALMGEALARRPRPLPDVVLPVPLHWRRLMRRGYNQAAVLAAAIARVVPLPIEVACAQRVRETADQIGMDAAARKRNVAGAFEMRRDLSGLRVALLDDVMTTGATLGALAEAARAAGAAEIEVWAAARVA